ncbi:hypothetical protein MW369_003461 [Vibrio parahaemolyticus]|nr:hypothetical protein [Vibrio parahaemolyticus]
MKKLPLNKEYRAAFESVVDLLKVAALRPLSKEEQEQLDEHMSICRHHEG